MSALLGHELDQGRREGGRCPGEAGGRLRSEQREGGRGESAVDVGFHRRFSWVPSRTGTCRQESRSPGSVGALPEAAECRQSIRAPGQWVLGRGLWKADRVMRSWAA